MRGGDVAAMEAGGMSWLGVIGLVATVICAVEGIVRLVRKDRRWGVALLGLAMAFWSPHGCSWDGMTCKEMPVGSAWAGWERVERAALYVGEHAEG